MCPIDIHIPSSRSPKLHMSSPNIGVTFQAPCFCTCSSFFLLGMNFLSPGKLLRIFKNPAQISPFPVFLSWLSANVVNLFLPCSATLLCTCSYLIFIILCCNMFVYIYKLFIALYLIFSFFRAEMPTYHLCILRVKNRARSYHPGAVNGWISVDWGTVTCVCWMLVLQPQLSLQGFHTSLMGGFTQTSHSFFYPSISQSELEATWNNQ